MKDPTITYFPVGNGDTTLIELADGTHVVIDCNIRKSDQENGVYDVREHLQRTFRKDAKAIHFLDAFILTHADEDHCRGFADNFYTGDPREYGDKHRKAGLVRVDELWFTPRIFERYKDPLCEDAKVFQKEVERRCKLHTSGAAACREPGNRIRVIGFTPRHGLEDVRTSPGNEVPRLNGTARSDISFFVHAPFKKDTEEDAETKNLASLVLHVRFNVQGVQHAVNAFFGGDAEWRTWENIQRLSKDRDLEYDLFLAPHHCSWTFFADTPYADNRTPSKRVLSLLAKKRQGAIVVASSRPIRNDDNNPPHWAAAKEYKRAVGEDKLLCTGEYPNEKMPKPIVFAITRGGPVKRTDERAGAIVSSGAVQRVVNTPHTYG